MTATDRGEAGDTCALAWLLGQSPLRKYLDFVRHMTADGAVPRAQLIDEWRVANDYYGELERTEAGIADRIETHELSASLRPLVREAMADTRFGRAFDVLPTRFAMAPLVADVPGTKERKRDIAGRAREGRPRMRDRLIPLLRARTPPLGLACRLSRAERGR